MSSISATTVRRHLNPGRTFTSFSFRTHQRNLKFILKLVSVRLCSIRSLFGANADLKMFGRQIKIMRQLLTRVTLRNISYLFKRSFVYYVLGKVSRLKSRVRFRLFVLLVQVHTRCTIAGIIVFAKAYLRCTHCKIVHNIELHTRKMRTKIVENKLRDSSVYYTNETIEIRSSTYERTMYTGLANFLSGRFAFVVSLFGSLPFSRFVDRRVNKHGKCRLK